MDMSPTSNPLLFFTFAISHLLLVQIVFIQGPITPGQTLKISDNGGGLGRLDVNLDDSDGFGVSTSLNGNTLVVGAYSDDDGGPNRGAAYIFEKSNNVWSQTLKISDSGGGLGRLNVDLDDSDYFGIAVSLNGNTLVVGAYSDDDGGPNRGAAYIFEKSNNVWSQTLKISDNGEGLGRLNVDLDDSDYFGRSVSLYGDTLVVGTFRDGDGGSNRGAAYIFEKSNNIWSQTLKISDNGGGLGILNVDLDDSDYFGVSASLGVNVLVVGASRDGDGGSNRGAAYIFEKSNNVWSQTLKISDSGEGLGRLDVNLDDSDGFGASTSLDGDTLVVGTFRDGDGGSNRGAAYIFEKSNNVWSQTLKISDSGGGLGRLNVDLDDSDHFGVSASLDEDALVVGAYSDDDGGSGKGAVYVFSFTPAQITFSNEMGTNTKSTTISVGGGVGFKYKLVSSSLPCLTSYTDLGLSQEYIGDTMVTNIVSTIPNLCVITSQGATKSKVHTFPQFMSPTDVFVFSGYVWNGVLKVWARLNCADPIAKTRTNDTQINVLAQGCVQEDPNRVIYNHDTGRLENVAHSPVIRDINFNLEVGECPTKESATSPTTVTRPEFVKLPLPSGELYGDNDRGIRLIGCARISFLNLYILLSPYHRDGSRIETLADQYTGWKGVWVEAEEIEIEETENETVRYEIKIANCGLTNAGNSTGLNLGWWSFGENIESVSSFNESCYGTSTIADDLTSAGEYLDGHGNVVIDKVTPSLKPSNAITQLFLGQFFRYGLNCGEFRKLKSIGGVSLENVNSSTTNVLKNVFNFFLGESSIIINLLASDALAIWTNDALSNELICEDERGFFPTRRGRPDKLSILKASIADFNVDKTVISRPDFITIKYDIINLSQDVLVCLIRELEADINITNEITISPGQNAASNLKHPILTETTLQAECSINNQKELISAPKKIKILPNTYKERGFSKSIVKSVIVVKSQDCSPDELMAIFPDNVDKADVFDFENNLLFELPIRNSLCFPAQTKPFYTVPYDTKLNEEGPKFRYIP